MKSYLVFFSSVVILFGLMQSCKISIVNEDNPTIAEKNNITGKFGYGTSNLISAQQNVPLSETAYPPIWTDRADKAQTVKYSIEPTLPEGLVINSETGVISGTPIQALAKAAYTVTAKGTATGTDKYSGSITAKIEITITIAIAIPITGTLEYEQSVLVFSKNPIAGYISPKWQNRIDDAQLVEYSIEPTLLNGLSINSETGAIGGAPTATADVKTYTVTAKGTGHYINSITTSLTIKIVEPLALPSISLGNTKLASGTTATTNITFTGTKPSRVGMVYTVVPSGTNTQPPTVPTIDRDTEKIHINTTTSAGSYTATISANAKSSYSGNTTAKFYVTVSPNDLASLEDTLETGIANFGKTADFNYIQTTNVTSMAGVFSPYYKGGISITLDSRPVNAKPYISKFNGNISDWDVSNVTDMHHMFYYSEIFNGDISNWKVNNVEDMSHMFKNAQWFNQNLNGWMVSKVTNMQGMFSFAFNFNQELSNWDVSSIADMSSMFEEADYFNKNLNTWTVSKVTNMSRMFKGAVDFNQDLTGWDVSKVTNMSAMFDASGFGGDMVFNGDLSGWNPESVTNMHAMFRSAKKFSRNINSWNVKNVTNMSEMFKDARAFNQDLSNWNVAKVTNMNSMFAGSYTSSTTLFNGDISSWNVESVTDMGSMFKYSISFNQDIGNWNVSKVTNMSEMFMIAIEFNQDISKWNVVNVTNMNSMFEYARVFDKDISSWNINKVSDMGEMFYAAHAFNQDLELWKDKLHVSVNKTDMFRETKALLAADKIPSWY